MDNHTSEQRHYNMAQIKSKDTIPELLIRKKLWHKGLRYRLHKNDLPGKPDIVFIKYKALVFIHGCFWHGHIGCGHFKLPASNIDYWTKKIESNRERDGIVLNNLRANGWRICIVWECAIKGKHQLLIIDETIQKVYDWVLSDSIWLEVTNKEYSK
jgi:DNA mismatch endonuclease (patch repair protein)